MSFFLADFIVVIHFTFILFVVAGGFLALKWPKISWIHLPSALWGAVIEFTGWICPLTPLENSLRQTQGNPGPGHGFVETYISALIYPEGLTREIQIALGLGVVLINAAIYGYLLGQGKKGPTKEAG